MEIIRHIISGPSSSMCLVHLGESISESKRSAHLRAVFQSPGTGRRKVAFACDSNELALFLSVLSREIEGESATIPISRKRGFVRVTSLKSGDKKVIYQILPSRKRDGTEGVVSGRYRMEVQGEYLLLHAS